MSDISNKGGKFKGDSHADGGIPLVVVETGQQIEVEGEEALVPSEVANDSKIYEMEGTNAEVLNKILKKVGAKTLNRKADEVHAGDMIICVRSTNDKAKHKYSGTLKQIVSKINESGGCNVIHEGGEQEFKDGGTADGGRVGNLTEAEKDKFRHLIEEFREPFFRNEMDRKEIAIYDKLVSKGLIIKGSVNYKNKQYYSDTSIDNLKLAYELVNELGLSDTVGGENIIRAYNFDADNPDIRFDDGGEITKSENFKKWFGDSKVVDSDGNPLVVYHGTTHDFTSFELDRGNIENAVGVGYYFTSSIEDANINYAGEGADLTNRIQGEVERVTSEIEYELDIEEIVEKFEVTEDEAEAMKDGDNPDLIEVIARREAKRRMKGSHDGAIIPAYLKMEKPFDLTEDAQELYIERDDEYYMEMAKDEVDKEDFLDEDEETGYDEDSYQDALREKSDEIYNEDYSPMEDGDGVALMEAIQNVIPRYDSTDEFQEYEIKDRFTDGITPKDLFDLIKSQVPYATNEEGELASTQILNEIVQEAGYDGFIQDAYNEFGQGRTKGKAMEGIEWGDRHYIVFESTQIKSAIGNNGNYDPNNPDITMGLGGELEKGKKVEMEHKNTIKKLSSGKYSTEQGAELIAKDHLKESNKYYSELEKVEAKFDDGGEIDEDSSDSVDWEIQQSSYLMSIILEYDNDSEGDFIITIRYNKEFQDETNWIVDYMDGYVSANMMNPMEEISGGKHAHTLYTIQFKRVSKQYVMSSLTDALISMKEKHLFSSFFDNRTNVEVGNALYYYVHINRTIDDKLIITNDFPSYTDVYGAYAQELYKRAISKFLLHLPDNSYTKVDNTITIKNIKDVTTGNAVLVLFKIMNRFNGLWTVVTPKPSYKDLDSKVRLTFGLEGIVLNWDDGKRGLLAIMKNAYRPLHLISDLNTTYPMVDLVSTMTFGSLSATYDNIEVLQSPMLDDIALRVNTVLPDSPTKKYPTSIQHMSNYYNVLQLMLGQNNFTIHHNNYTAIHDWKAGMVKKPYEYNPIYYEESIDNFQWSRIWGKLQIIPRITFNENYSFVGDDVALEVALKYVNKLYALSKIDLNEIIRLVPDKVNGKDVQKVIYLGNDYGYVYKFSDFLSTVAQFKYGFSKEFIPRLNKFSHSIEMFNNIEIFKDELKLKAIQEVA